MTESPILVAAVPTPFTGSGDLDLPAAGRLFQAVDRSGVDAMFIAGTTGEFADLTFVERVAVIEAALSVSTPQRVIAHVGSTDIGEAVALVAAARTAGATRFAAITPYGMPEPSQIRDYYEALCDPADGSQMYAYLFPAQTGTTISRELLADLATIDGLTGAKVTIPGAEAISEYASAVPEDFELYSGSDRDFAAAVRAGARGVVSGLSAAVPEPFLAMAAAIVRADAAEQSRAQELVDRAAAAIGPSIELLKLALDVRGLPGGPTRARRNGPDSAARQRVIDLCAELDLTEPGVAFRPVLDQDPDQSGRLLQMEE
jgi:4-hydroxy-tetrahydrodipicolinate synthase